MTDYYLAIDVGKRNMGFCIYNGVDFGYSILDIEEQIPSNVRTKYGAKGSKIVLLSQFINSICDGYKIQKVVIEQQVSKNVEAMIIQTIIETLFINKGIVVREFAPIDKFKYLNPQYDSKKKEHKKISIEYAKNILNHHNLTSEEFTKFSKKDDISDAICMAFMEYHEDNNTRDIIYEYLVE